MRISRRVPGSSTRCTSFAAHAEPCDRSRTRHHLRRARRTVDLATFRAAYLNYTDAVCPQPFAEELPSFPPAWPLQQLGKALSCSRDGLCGPLGVAVDGEALVQWATLIMLAAALLVLVWVVQRKTAVQVREDACM